MTGKNPLGKFCGTGKEPKIDFETCQNCGDSYVLVYLGQVDCQHCQPIKLKPWAYTKRPPYNTKDYVLMTRPEGMDRVDRAIRFGHSLHIYRRGKGHGN